MYERLRVNVRAEWGSTLMLTHDLWYIASLLFMGVKFICVHK